MDTPFDKSAAYQHLIGQGRDAAQHGQTDLACRHFMAAAELAAADPLKLNDIGLALAGMKRIDLARDVFFRTLALDPGNALANAQLGWILLYLQEPARAETHLQIASAAHPDEPTLLYNLGQAYQFQKKITRALDAYRKAVACCRDSSPQFHSQLATLLEITNKLDELSLVLTKALKIFPDDARLNFLMAKYDRRQGNPEPALERLKRIQTQNIGPELRSLMYYEMGRIHDKMGACDAAYACFEEANKAQETIYTASRISKDQATSHLWTMNALDLNRVNEKIAGSPTPAAHAPVFLVGFPRSGTTLLHQILEAHPLISVLEEHSIIHSIQKGLGLHREDYADALYALDDDAIIGLGKKYLDAIHTLTAGKKSARTIDKLPLNILNIPLIKILFPNARIILALRSPCDSILSCYMQRFTPNSYMAHFHNLDDATRFYADTMGLFTRYAEELSLEYYPIRYEDLVTDFENETRNIIRFLGLEWDDATLNYRQRAMEQEIIDTPSYHQVVRPLYSDAIERWRRYEKHFSPYMERLAPFYERFGYTL